MGAIVALAAITAAAVAVVVVVTAVAAVAVAVAGAAVVEVIEFVSFEFIVTGPERVPDRWRVVEGLAMRPSALSVRVSLKL